MVPKSKVRSGVPFLVLLALTAFLVVFAAACSDDATTTSTAAPTTATPTTAPTDTATTAPTGTATTAPTETATTAPTETATTAPTETATETATESPTEPATEQVLNVQAYEPEKLDPHQSNFAQDIALARMLFRGLYQLDEAGQPVPAMAADMPELNGNVYTITLKPGLLWSDGQPMTAADFVYGVQEGCNPVNASPYQYVLAAGYAGIVGCNEFFAINGTADAPLTPTDEEIQAARDAVGITAIDDMTLEITVDRPTATFPTIMSLWVAFPLRQDIVEQFGADWVKPENMVVNGPFMLESYVPKDGAVLVPNPNWALEPKPQLTTLNLRFIDDLEAAFRGFQSGDLDITNVGAQSIPVIEGDETLSSQFIKLGSGRIETIEMNLERPPLDNFDVRLALSQAMDREAINTVVYNGVNIPALFWTIQGLAGHVGNEEFPDIDFNPEAAKESLARAGYPDGEGFPTLTLLNREDPTQRALGEFLQNQWKEILNIDVELEFVDAATRSARFNAEDFDLFRGGWGIDYPDIENTIGGLFNTDGGNNHYNCSDPEIDAKIAEAQAATDNDARIAAWSEAAKLIVHKLCGTAPFAQLAATYLVSGKVGGMMPNGALDASIPGDTTVEYWFVAPE